MSNVKCKSILGKGLLGRPWLCIVDTDVLGPVISRKECSIICVSWTVQLPHLEVTLYLRSEKDLVLLTRFKPTIISVSPYD